MTIAQTGLVGLSSTVAKLTVSPPYNSLRVGEWRSLVAHLNGVQGAAGSNPVSPISASWRYAKTLKRLGRLSKEALEVALVDGQQFVNLEDVVG